MNKIALVMLIKFLPIPVRKNKNYIYTYWNSGFIKFQRKITYAFPAGIKIMEKYLLRTKEQIKNHFGGYSEFNNGIRKTK